MAPCSGLDRNKALEELFPAKEIWNDEICAHLDQPLPLPLVYDPAFGFIRRHPDCDTTGIFDVLDFNISVAESNQLIPRGTPWRKPSCG